MSVDPSIPEEIFDPNTGEPIEYSEDSLGGEKQNKMKGGFGEDRLINGYINVSKGLTALKNSQDFNLVNNGISVGYKSLNEEDKKRHLKNFAGIIYLFIKLFNKKPDYVKSRMPSSGGKKSKKQRGGADEMNFSKMYNTQGLIIDNNDPIENAMAYNNTADQIPQPFSSGSSGAASYTSGIDAQSLQDVLPVLGMTGGDKKKSK